MGWTNGQGGRAPSIGRRGLARRGGVLALVCVVVGALVPAWAPSGAGGVATAAPPPAESVEGASDTGPRLVLRGHSHNDYWQTRPLLDALDLGFCSVEADVFLIEGELRVGHDVSECRPGRTLESLYLEPLLERVLTSVARGHGPRVYVNMPEGGFFTLFIDVKRDGVAAYQHIERTLRAFDARCPGLFTRFVREGSRVIPGAIWVVISGDRACQAMAEQNDRLAFFDGRLSDLAPVALTDAAQPDAPPGQWCAGTPNTKPVPTFMPVISDAWRSHFSWPGVGPMPERERRVLHEFVREVHARGGRIRFWGTPNLPEMWRTLYDAGVDLINCDELAHAADELGRLAEAGSPPAARESGR
ncbi:MAG: phosphatidylinositol-specific phospholipase C/glycerophosphodiester phosphodiesterase family protein [Planctomycetota bacterium]|nr:phosphatidylinositol-specific phospholipase C/glycerophosphodiester phosphodiesterase family protein [Planctomycetota bacterium]